MRSSLRLAVATLAAALFAVNAAVTAVAAPPYAGRIGVELNGIGDGDRSKPFVDLAKTLRPFTRPGTGDAAPTDANGWPTGDAQTVLFDIRPVPAWAPPIDDPDAFQPDWSGVYHLSFQGQAALASPDSGSKFTVSNQRYDRATNATTAELTVPPGTGLLVVSFTHTKRTPGSPDGSGFTDLRIVRPGYPANTRQVFTSEFLRMLAPFRVLRFMDWLDTNHQPGYYGDAGHHALEWKDRHVPTDATQVNEGGKYGASWEYVVLLANQTGKDIWINVPVAATDDYVRNLARFLKKDLNPKAKIYIEHSNEVWNFGFPQYTYNKLAAIDEVKRGGSKLNADSATDPEVWTHRRHAARLIQIAEIFRSIYGNAAMMQTIRPVYASWLIQPDSHYADVLKWVGTAYGPPSRYFYALADAAYFNAQKASKTASVDEILAAMRADSDHNVAARQSIQRIAEQYGLKHFEYEVGPDNGGGSTENVANRIRANRAPGMKDLILHDATDNWFARGGDLYMYFAAPGAYSRYGCWGLSEDVNQLNTPKWQAIYALTGHGAR